MEGKLVRDKIPEIIRADGEEPNIRILSESEYLDALDRKLEEEVAEYLEANDLSELADILEVIKAIAFARGSTFEAMESARADKHSERGGFDKRIFLVTE